MKKTSTLLLILSIGLSAFAQIDTVNTKNLKLNIAAFKEGKSSYAVYFEDSLGHRLSSAAIWDRTIKLSKDAKGKSTYFFGWDWYQKDSLLAHIEATGEITIAETAYSLRHIQKARNFRLSIQR